MLLQEFRNVCHQHQWDHLKRNTSQVHIAVYKAIQFVCSKNKNKKLSTSQLVTWCVENIQDTKTMPESVSIHEQYARIKTLNKFLDAFIQLKMAWKVLHLEIQFKLNEKLMKDQPAMVKKSRQNNTDKCVGAEWMAPDWKIAECN